ncbi:MAG TPA: STAS domain-containing protein [Isosphaeraceae bacterium]|jgi:anti-anti-sigma factor|nr:STAS domain-containing protein [Isosphaeraceae bacterium]
MLKPRVQVRNEGGVLIAEFWDCLRLDPAPVQELRKQFESHLRAKGRPEIIVDLNGVGFAGSAALGGFLGLNKLAHQRDGRMVFCNVDATVYEVFRVSKLVPLFTFEQDLASALTLVNSPVASRDGQSPPQTKPEPGTDGKAPRSDSGAPLRRSRKQPG